MRPYPSYPTRKGGDFFNLQIQPLVVFASERSERASSRKPQAASSGPASICQLTLAPGYYRMYLERNNMEIDYRDENMKRIADALEEILRLVKKDMEDTKKRWEEKDE